MSKISIKNLNFYYKNSKTDIVHALNNVSVDFEDNKVNVVFGPNGAGKTSLLRCILGFEDYSGIIEIDGKPIEKVLTKNRNMAYISQDIVLYPFLNVFHNIANPLTSIGTSTNEIRSRVIEVAKFLDIEPLLFRKPRELSVGQAQKVVLAKAIIKKPDIYLFDELFANIDELYVRSMRLELKSIFKSLGATVIMITHNIDDAITLADKMFIMDNGKIIDFGDPIKMLKEKRLK